MQRNPNGQFYWVHQDHLGSGRKMTDGAGNMVYRAELVPFGNHIYEWSSPTILNTRKFTGYERDAANRLKQVHGGIMGMMGMRNGRRRVRIM